jgi:hypothetical protein
VNLSEWVLIEGRFRRVITQWARFKATHLNRVPELQEICSALQQLASASISAEAFADTWKRQLSPMAWMDPALQLLNVSRSGKTPAEIISRTEECLAMEVAISLETPVLNCDDYLYNYEEKMESLPYGSLVCPDFAFYGLYVAWNPLSKIIVANSNRELLKAARCEPRICFAISPRRFEELVAYIFECLGCEVTLTKQSRDFGADVLAVHGAPLGSEFLIAVQVKRYAPNRKVGLKEVFDLHGAMAHYNADLGQVVATSNFTDPAVQFARTQRIHLATLQDLEREIQRIVGR